MEISNLPVMSKRLWSMVRILFFMRPKGFTKPKLLMHLNLMLKRPGKIAAKAIANLISHHHRHHSHHRTSAVSHDAPQKFCTSREYEFSCSNTPKHSFFSKSHIIPDHFLACAHAPLTLDDDAVAVDNDLKAALEMLEYDKKGKGVVVASPPALRGSGRTGRMVRRVRVTDSPFPALDDDHDGDHQVDMEAEEFIKSFYMELMKQG